MCMWWVLPPHELREKVIVLAVRLYRSNSAAMSATIFALIVPSQRRNSAPLRTPKLRI